MIVHPLRVGALLLGLCLLPSFAVAQGAGNIPAGPTSGTPSDPTIGATAAPTSMSGPGSGEPGTPTKADGAIPGTKVPETGQIGSAGSGNSRN